MHVAALLLLALISARGYANAHAAEADSSVKEVYIWGQQPTSAATEQTRWQRDLQLKAVKQARFEPAQNDGRMSRPSSPTFTDSSFGIDKAYDEI